MKTRVLVEDNWIPLQMAFGILGLDGPLGRCYEDRIMGLQNVLDHPH